MEEYQTIDFVFTKKSQKRYRICIGVSTCCTILFLAIAIGFPFLIDWAVGGQAKSGIVMTPETEELWAHIPGATESTTYRNFTFFNFTNPREVLYRGQRPIFREISGYSYLEKQDFENIRYIDGGNAVQYDLWLHFDQSPTTRNVNEKVKVVNLGPLGFWYQLKTTDFPTFAIQGFGQLTFQLRQTFKTTVLGQALSQQFLPNRTNFDPLASAASLSTELANMVWSDLQFGLSDPNNYEIWVKASQDRDGDDYKILINYFTFEPEQFMVLLDQFSEWLEGLQGIIGNWYCGKRFCPSEQLTFLQLSRSTVTANPPPGTAPTNSICDQNVTCIGRPQISSYLLEVFPKEYPDLRPYYNLTFTPDEMRRWFMPCNKSKIFCLLHAGNMGWLWDVGRRFDKNQNQSDLQLIKDKLSTATLGHAFVVWSYVKYVTYEFVLKQEKKGTRAIAGVGGVASQAFYSVFSFVQDWLGDLLVLTKISSKIGQKFGSCEQFLTNAIENITQQQVQGICKGVFVFNSTSFNNLLDVCQYEFTKSWRQLKQANDLTNNQMLQLCDRNSPSSFGYLIGLAHQQIDQHYNCRITPTKMCSNFELALKQWNNSQITRNPIPQLNKTKFPASTTVHSWDNSIPEFQYPFFLEVANSTSTFRPSLEGITQLISFDCLFSGPVIQEIMLQNNEEQFKKKYNWSEPELLKQYLKFLSIEVGFGGFTQQRTVQELLFGYEDDFLKNLRDMDPAQGGDPSINIVVALNDLNSTRQEAKMYPISMYTGKNNFNITRCYRRINGLDYTNFNYSYWNGDEVVHDVKSPWAIQDHFIGTDAFQSAPALKPNSHDNNISIYISTLYRYGQAFYNQTIEKHGMEIYLARVDPKLYLNQYENPDNAKYYMHYGCFLNISSVNGAPVFISKNHFYDCPRNWSQMIGMYDEQQKYEFQPNIWDDTYIHIEPNTGTTFCATIYLQTNYYLEQDDLFWKNQTFMLPIFSIWRSGNISEHAVQKYFGPLKIAIKIRKISLFLGIAMAGLLLLLTIGLILRFKQLQKRAGVGYQMEEPEETESKRQPQLMISLQPANKQPELVNRSSEQAQRVSINDDQSRHSSFVEPPSASVLGDRILNETINESVVPS